MQLGLLLTIFSLGGGPISNNPYILGYKRMIKNNKALRFGINYFTSNSNTRVNPQQPRNYFNTKEIDFRIGIEWRKPISKKLSWFYGVDAATNYDLSKNNSTQLFFDGISQVPVKNITSSSTTSFGGGPVSGIQWHITPRISLFAEGRAYVFYSEQHTKTRWEDVSDRLRQRIPNGFEEKDNVDYFSNFNINLPLDLFFAFKF